MAVLIQQMMGNVIEHVDTFIQHQTNYYDSASRKDYLPAENNYQELVKWIERQKAGGEDYLAEAGGNIAQMARNLSKVVHWAVDEHSLRRAIARKKT